MDTSWMVNGAKAEVTMGFGVYTPGATVYIDEPPGTNGVVTVVPAPGSGDWQFMPITALKQVTD